jgi:hypothetical protein
MSFLLTIVRGPAAAADTGKSGFEARLCAAHDGGASGDLPDLLTLLPED